MNEQEATSQKEIEASKEDSAPNLIRWVSFWSTLVATLFIGTFTYFAFELELWKIMSFELYSLIGIPATIVGIGTLVYTFKKLPDRRLKKILKFIGIGVLFFGVSFLLSSIGEENVDKSFLWIHYIFACLMLILLLNIIFLAISRKPIKLILIFFSIVSGSYGIYHIYQGKLIEVLTYLDILLFGIGVFFVLIFFFSKETLIWLIGYRSEYHKLLKISENIALSTAKTVLKYTPTGLNDDENERLANDVPMIIQMRIMAYINNYIIKIFTGIFAAAFGLLGTIVLLNQNEKIDIQNERINIQSNLMEAERRSSLVFLMSNILDKVDDEIKEQQIERDELIQEGIYPESEYSLSKPLIGRIIALSSALEPYRTMEGDTLSLKKSSPERTQLFKALFTNNLDKNTKELIFNNGDFSYAKLGQLDLKNFYLYSVKLNGASLEFSSFDSTTLLTSEFNYANLTLVKFSEANIRYTTFRNSNLLMANFKGADLEEVDFSNADLSYAKFKGVDFKKVNFNGSKLKEVDFGTEKEAIEKLRQVKSLYNVKELNPKLKEELNQQKPCLFTKKGCN